MRPWRVLIGVLVLTLPVAGAAAPSSDSATSSLSCALSTVSTWPLARLANETIAVSVNAADIGAMGPAARAGYGGLLLFGATAPDRFAGVVATLQRETPDQYTMLVMTDQEGGGVQRLTNLVATLPWAQTMGKNLTPAQITAVAERVGRSMKAAGLNTDLAPVLDVDARAVAPGVGDPDGFRSFSGVADRAAVDGVAFANGLRDVGVIAVAKHFPGLGGATGNTDDAPAATIPWSRLQTSGLVPFRAAVRDGVPAIMVSNATVPGLSRLPSSISPAVLQVLRQELGFQGLIVTDSLSAGALRARHLGVPAASVLALKAGADLVLAGSPPSSASSLRLAAATSNALQGAVRAGNLAVATLRAAAAQALASVNQPVCPATTTT